MTKDRPIGASPARAAPIHHTAETELPLQRWDSEGGAQADGRVASQALEGGDIDPRMEDCPARGPATPLRDGRGTSA